MFQKLVVFLVALLTNASAFAVSDEAILAREEWRQKARQAEQAQLARGREILASRKLPSKATLNIVSISAGSTGIDTTYVWPALRVAVVNRSSSQFENGSGIALWQGTQRRISAPVSTDYFSDWKMGMVNQQALANAVAELHKSEPEASIEFALCLYYGRFSKILGCTLVDETTLQSAEKEGATSATVTGAQGLSAVIKIITY